MANPDSGRYGDGTTPDDHGANDVPAFPTCECGQGCWVFDGTIQDGCEDCLVAESHGIESLRQASKEHAKVTFEPTYENIVQELLDACDAEGERARRDYAAMGDDCTLDYIESTPENKRMQAAYHAWFSAFEPHQSEAELDELMRQAEWESANY